MKSKIKVYMKRRESTLSKIKKLKKKANDFKYETRSERSSFKNKGF